MSPSTTSLFPTLLLIDNQVGILSPQTQPYFGKGPRSNQAYESSINTLLDSFRTYLAAKPESGSIIHLYHSSSSADSPLHPSNPSTMAIVPDLAPANGEVVISKSTSSAFISTKLEASLRETRTTHLIVAGLVLDQCVSSTIRSAYDLLPPEVKTVLVSDATATLGRGEMDAETVHDVTVESLREEFCEVWSAEEVVKWLDDRIGGEA